MFSLRTLIVFLGLIALCYCDTSVARGKKPYHHHHKHLFFHEFYYLIFLAFKFKIILVLGTIWTFSIFFGKVFAAIKLAEYMKKNYYHDDHHEKIVYMPPHHDHYGSYEYPGVYGKSYSSGPFPGGSDFSSDISPPDAYPGGSFGDSAPGQVYDSPPHGVSGRSDNETGGILDSFNSFSRIVRELNTTDIVLREMHLVSDECKRKFVCEAEFNVKQSTILKTVWDFLSDDSYQKYKTNQTIATIDDCARLNPGCHEDTTR